MKSAAAFLDAPSAAGFLDSPDQSRPSATEFLDAPESQPSLLDQTASEYPVVGRAGMQFKNNPGGGKGYLEFWPAGEKGDEGHPRPPEFALDKPGVEVYDQNTGTKDIAADVASHHLVNTDPVVGAAYRQFAASLTNQQKTTLQQQYQWAEKNEGEDRSYSDWLRSTGLPAAFRGYAFDQWPQEFNDKFYTPEQKKLLDGMVDYLKTGKEQGDQSYTGPLSERIPGSMAKDVAQGIGQHGAFMRQFIGTSIGGNPKMFGESLEGLGEITNSPSLAQLGTDISSHSGQILDEYKQRVGSFTQIPGKDFLDSIDRGLTYAGESAGQATGSTMPSLVIGGATALITRNPRLGKIFGEAAPAYVLNYGDMYSSLKDDKGVQAKLADGSLTKKDLAQISAAVTVPLTALDVYSMENITKGMFSKEARAKVKESLLKVAVKHALSSGATEGTTEGLQQILEEGTEAAAGDTPFWTKDRWVSIGDNFFGGLFGGTVMGGGAKVAEHLVPGPDEGEQWAHDVEHGQFQTPAADVARDAFNPNPGGIDAASYNGRISGPMPAPEAPITPPAHPQPDTAVELTDGDRASPIDDQTILDGKRLVAEAEVSAKVSDILNQHGLPPLGSRVTLDLGDGVTHDGEIAGAFSHESPELGTAHGVQLKLDNGQTFEEFLDVLKQNGARIMPALDAQLAAEKSAPLPGAGAEGAQGAAPMPQSRPAAASAPNAEPGSVLPGAAGQTPGFDENLGAVPGTAAAPVDVTHADDMNLVRPHVETSPTPEQKETGLYTKGHMTWNGLDIAIENPKGSLRTGTGPDGQPWSVKMPGDYGYIKRTEGADGDHVDITMGPHPQSKRVWVIDQHDAGTHQFDEHKAFAGYATEADATAAYDASFSDGKGPQRRAALTEMGVDQFKTWVKTGDTKAALAQQKTEAPPNASEFLDHGAEDHQALIDRVAKQYEGVAPSPVAAARMAGYVVGAATTGRYHEVLGPRNKKSRQIFQDLTGTKLPAGEAATKALFTGKPFKLVKQEEPADVQSSFRPSTKEESSFGKFRGTASTNEGGFNSVHAWGETPVEAIANAKRLLEKSTGGRKPAKMDRLHAAISKATGAKGINVIRGEKAGASYDPLLRTITVGPDIEQGDVSKIAELTKGAHPQGWRTAEVRGVDEDGDTVELGAGVAADALSARIRGAIGMLECLG